MSAARVRPATAEDAGDLARLVRELGYDATPEDCAARLAALRAGDAGEVLVAEAEGRPIGLAHVQRRRALLVPDHAELGALVVEAGHRGGGVGRALVDAAQAWASARGLPSLHLRARIEREGAHGFYGRLGFERVKTQHAFRRDAR